MAPKKDNYDERSITVLEGLEAVRVRPGMYIGSVSTKGLNHLIYEIVKRPLSLSISCHIGPGALAVAVSKKI